MIRRFARWVLRPWYDAAAIIADVQQHPAQANPPGPGTSPAPTPDEAVFLARMQALREFAQPGHLQAARDMADGLRLRFPQYSDTELGMFTLDLLGYLKAFWIGVPDKERALSCAMDAFGLAAEEMTRLARNDEVPR